mmetsp:Transcript_58758/g.91331  ORF Transcript_58758/g.91331 Transcript_58758/m.91331 type:complete len:754 (+) Transcript_58758:109-2370(+)
MGTHVPDFLCIFLLLVGDVLTESDQKSYASTEPHWFLVPVDDLAAFEALEFAILRINEMRMDCDGFNLAPLQRSNYNATEVYVRDYGLYAVYRLHISSINGLAPVATVVDIAKKHSVSDLSLFQVVRVEPGPCDLYSELDDAELLVPWKSAVAKQAKNVAMELINEERKLLCPQRPSLQFIRIEAASVQPAQGKVVRLVLEMREASDSFQTSSFTDVVTVIYALDQDVPSQCTTAPEVYPGRKPCKMRYTEEEESATSEGEVEGTHKKEGEEHEEHASPRALREMRQRAQQRRLSGVTDVGDEEYIRPFKEKHLDIPNEFDPRLERTLCFPRGFSRQQGSCGASWAFAATAVASFRECLENLRTGEIDVGLSFMSAQELTSCNPEMGCSGGSASGAFYYMKYKGISREVCTDYRMRCFVDNSMISVSAADTAASTPKSKHFKASGPTCSVQPDPDTSPCKCLPSIFHYSRPIECSLLPSACRKHRIPHYFKIAGTSEGNTIPEIEQHMKQEMIAAGPLYVSILVYDDFYDPVSWTESGVYVHKRGNLIGKHGVMAAGWGTDLNGRQYWLLLNSFGSGWQQEGYFKVLRGRTSLEMMKFGAWGVDWTNPDVDVSKPGITEVELAFSPVVSEDLVADPIAMLANVWLQISAKTDENARVLVRVQGLKSTVTGGARDHDFISDHVLKIDLLSIGLIGERAKVQLWAVDEAENTASWGPLTFDIPSKTAFVNSQKRRLSSVANLENASFAGAEAIYV